MRLYLPALYAGAIGFGSLGLALLIAPDLMAIVDLGPATATARSDVRAVYGGLELGLGVFCAMCARRPPWVRAGLTVQALALGGVVLGRILSLVVDGPPELPALLFGAGEGAVGLLAVVALHSLERRSEPSAS